MYFWEELFFTAVGLTAIGSFFAGLAWALGEPHGSAGEDCGADEDDRSFSHCDAGSDGGGDD